MTLHDAAITRALDERRTYRDLLLAALDQLAAAGRQIARQQEQLDALRLELRERMGVPRDLR